MPISSPTAFWQEARYQRGCAVCGSIGQFEAHHVIEKQWLKRNGLPLWDTRGALRLCLDCHPGQTSKLAKVKLRDLTLDSIEYAFEIMGPAAGDYLRRHYDGEDPRLLAFEENPDESDYGFAMRISGRGELRRAM